MGAKLLSPGAAGLDGLEQGANCIRNSSCTACFRSGLDYVTGPKAVSTVLAKNYVGMPLN